MKVVPLDVFDHEPMCPEQIEVANGAHRIAFVTTTSYKNGMYVLDDDLPDFINGEEAVIKQESLDEIDWEVAV
ncbi:hypothetical protein [Fructobacillus fructosus]|uniref:hypothetical protein n=1 Tax=Fructobacillus fructosus TaxID=1631 RepID=UPI002DA796B9|nr:unnamed protein product [Fructobacillus fructosus]CAK1251049.1 unnamed protein product [Fructobacillus fructosus]CAK1252627.1 unnamed protein product [Fructobacillus fructosus]